MNTYKLTLLAIFAAVAVVGRVLFVFIPNVQPVTAMVIITGVLLGPLSGLIIAILATFLSNMVLGLGLWAIWQITSWGFIGIIAGIMGKYIKNIPLYVLLAFGLFSGYLYGFMISLTSYQVTGKFWPYYLAGLPFDTNHAIGNFVFILLLYPTIVYLTKRYAKGRFQLQQL